MRPEDIRPGTRWGRLLVEQEIGAGAYGVVYRALDTLLDRPVALKVMRPSRFELTVDERKRFLAEARLVARLRCSHVVTLYGVETLADDAYALEMEFVEGGTLADLLAENERLPPREAVRFLVEVVDALAAAHAAGVVHGDIKPENVLRTKDGTAKLADFGLARVVGERELAKSASSAGTAVLGTPYYMAPEVILGEGTLPASDVWSLGVVAYRMLAGRLPFDADNLPALFWAVQNATPPPLPADVPPALSALVLRCLSKRASDRPLPGGDLEALLRDALAAPAAASAPIPPAFRSAAAPTAPLLGREEEIRRLERELAAASAGQGRTVLVTGEAGIGKTALLREVRARAEASGFRWIHATLSRTEGLLRPLLDAVRLALAAENRAGTDPLERIGSASFGPAAGLLRRLFGGEGEAEIEGRQQAVWALQHLLAGLSRDRPTALVLEGAQNAEAGEVAILRDLARRVPEHRAALVVASRTSEGGAAASGSGALAPLAEVEGVLRIHLEALPRETLYAALEASLSVRLSPEVAERVVSRAEGNPLFALETLRHLEAAGAVVRADGEIRPGDRWGVETIPSRLADLVAARVKSLPASQRAILDVAAVDGVVFDGEAIAAVLKRDLLQVLRALQRLARDQGFVIPQANGYRFAHSLFRDALYEEVAPELRRELHRRLAEHLESRRPPADPERLGTHWERAGDSIRARRYLLEAAAAAVQRCEAHRAIELASRGGLPPGAMQPEAIAATPELALQIARLCQALSNRQEDTERAYEAIMLFAHSREDPDLALRAVARRAHWRYFKTGWTDTDEAEVRRAAERLPPSVDRGRARYTLGVVEKYRGHLQEAERWLRSAEPDFAVALESVHRSSLRDQLASLAFRRGEFDTAERTYLEAEDLATDAGHVTNAAISAVNAVIAAIAAGRLEGLETRLMRAVRTLVLEGVEQQAAHALVVLAQLRMARGDLRGARQALEEAERRMAVAKNLPGFVAARRERGRLDMLEGRLDDARRAYAEARDAAEKQGDRGSVAEAWALEAQRACCAGDYSGARDATAHAVEAIRHGADSASIVDSALALVEASTYGLPADALPPFAAVLREGPVTLVPPLRDLLGRVIEAAASWTKAPGGEALSRGADALGDPAFALQSHALRAVAALWRARRAAERGDPASAASLSDILSTTAARDGLGWLALAALREACRVQPTPQRRAAHAAALERQAALVPESMRDALRRAWTPPAGG